MTTDEQARRARERDPSTPEGRDPRGDNRVTVTRRNQHDRCAVFLAGLMKMPSHERATALTLFIELERTDERRDVARMLSRRAAELRSFEHKSTNAIADENDAHCSYLNSVAARREREVMKVEATRQLLDLIDALEGMQR